MIREFGESALLVELGSSVPAQALAAAIEAGPPDGVLEVVPGLSSLLVELSRDADRSRVADVIADLLPGLPDEEPRGRRRVIPVLYGGEHGPDLAGVAALTGLTEAEVVERHASGELRVLFDGFAPGFAYLGELPPELRVPRLATPRTRTPAGSVAVADAMSGVYPADLPGGWRVIGRTPITLFDPHRNPPAYLVPGDVVSFERISAADWDARRGAPDDWSG